MGEISAAPHIIGWIGTIAFFTGAWLIGHKRFMSIRRYGLIFMVSSNLLYVAQGLLLSNHSLLALSVGAAVLQTRAYFNWKNKK